MLYYTSLLLIVVLVSGIASLVYRALFGASNSVYESKLVDGKQVSKRTQARLKASRKARLKATGTSSSLSSETPAPWGWNANSSNANAVRHLEKSGGHSDFTGSGNDFVPLSNAESRKNVGWPYKEEKLEFAGKAYKVNRKATEGGDLTSSGKPWVW